MKMLIYGNLLPIHEPLRLAEELSMLDCLSNGRLISGFARGIPREYLAYNISMGESRARFEEAYKIIKQAWTEEVFSYEGDFWSYNDVAIWPRPVQQPHPPVWIPVSASQETLDWAGRENVPISPGALGTLAGRQDMVRYYGRQLAENGHTLTPEHIIGTANVFVSGNREQALDEAGPYMVYFYRTLFGHGNTANVERQRATGYRTERNMEWLSPENREDFLNSIQTFREATMESIQHQDRLCFGHPDEVRDSIIDLAESLGSNVLMLHFNRGSMPHSMFMNQIERFGREVLPALHEHQVTQALN
jgi:alkanesulfonate monooxygenase SsuD/methylene tetrahydromethanopterin reductase-like flavin-dependent oxidoreductase (luciferase family)